MRIGMWGIAVVVIVIVSWLLYRYLAPENWIDRDELNSRPLTQGHSRYALHE